MQIISPCVGGELKLSTDCSDGCGDGGKVHNDPQQLPGLGLVTNKCLTLTPVQGTPTMTQPAPTVAWQLNMCTGACLPMWEGEVPA